MCQQCHIIVWLSSTTSLAHLMHKPHALNFLNAKLLKSDEANLFPYTLGILTTKKKFSASVEWLAFSSDIVST